MTIHGASPTTSQHSIPPGITFAPHTTTHPTSNPNVVQQTWRAILNAAARTWQAGEYKSSITLQREALEYAETLDGFWPLLWSCTQLGMCRALTGEGAQAVELLRRAGAVATQHGQAVVAGLCLAAEALCSRLAQHQQLSNMARTQLCDIHRGLVQYLRINQYPLADVCWPVELASAPAQTVQRSAATLSQPIQARPEIEISFLGRFALRVGDQPLTNLPTGRSGALLKYLLANHSQLIPLDMLLEQFWPDAEPAAGRNRFHQTMYSLRGSLSAMGSAATPLQIICNECRYGFTPGLRVWVDSEAFEQLVAAGRQAEQEQQVARAIDLYREAATLYQGDFLAEDRYVDWVHETRSRLSNLYVSTYDRLSLLYFASGDPHTALDYCDYLLAMDKCHENIHQRAMHCYAALGQRTQALRQYEVCTQALRKELDLEPLPETTELYHQIKDDQHTLPQPLLYLSVG